MPSAPPPNWDRTPRARSSKPGGDQSPATPTASAGSYCRSPVGVQLIGKLLGTTTLAADVGEVQDQRDQLLDVAGVGPHDSSSGRKTCRSMAPRYRSISGWVSFLLAGECQNQKARKRPRQAAPTPSRIIRRLLDWLSPPHFPLALRGRAIRVARLLTQKPVCRSSHCHGRPGQELIPGPVASAKSLSFWVAKRSGEICLRSF
jgi:hypothetical protein